VRTAPHSDKAAQTFTIIHPFHPWHGRQFELIELCRRWGQWRVRYLTESGDTAYMPASFTDIGAKDPFVEQAQGRAIARTEDLLELVKMIRGSVKTIKPQS
jgi:hypothetical protein